MVRQAKKHLQLITQRTKNSLNCWPYCSYEMIVTYMFDNTLRVAYSIVGAISPLLRIGVESLLAN